MGETSSQSPLATGMTPDIGENRLLKGVVDNLGRFAEPEAASSSEKIVVRLRRTQMTVSLSLNTKLLAERREMKRANEEIRRTGR